VNCFKVSFLVFRMSSVVVSIFNGNGTTTGTIRPNTKYSVEFTTSTFSNIMMVRNGNSYFFNLEDLESVPILLTYSSIMCGH
jgi:hypothetical protein